MIDNDSLKQAFGSLERHAPDETDVLAGVYQGIHRRRRRRQVASVAVVAGAASLVALGVVIVSPGQGTGPGGSPQAIAPGASQTTATAPAPSAPELPFTAGWLPQGYTLGAWEVGSTTGSAQYTATRDFEAVVVWISDQPRDAVRDAVDEPATIAGRPGTIRTLPGGIDTQLIWQLADGRWAMVGGRVPTVPLDALHRVAQNLTARPTPLNVDLGLSGLPDDYQVAGWTGVADSGTVTLCREAIDLRGGNRPGDCVTVQLKAGTAPATVPGPLVVRKGDDKTPTTVPVDQKELVDGVVTRATADGMLALAQVDAGHWVQAFSQEAGDDTLRETVVLATVR